MANPKFDPNKMHFFYKGKYLGSCDPEYIECPELLKLMESDNSVASQILTYMNSLGDPVFPISEEDWGTPETDITKIDIEDLYETFLQEIDYDYSDYPDEFYVGGDYLLPDFEIFVGSVADDVEACGDARGTAIKASTKSPKFEIIRDDDGVSGYKLGNWYLMKLYYWANNYTWYVLNTPEIYLSDYEKRQMHHVSGDNDQGYVSNLKEGKQILLDRYQKEFGDNVQACGDIKASTEPNEPDAKLSKLVDKMFKEAKEVADYLSTHNKNLSKKQDYLVMDLSDAVDSRSTSAVREAIAALNNHTKGTTKAQEYRIVGLYYKFFAGGEYSGLGRNYADDDVQACGDIKCSTNPRYMATMVNASDDGYEQLVEGDDSDDVWEEPKYYARSYYGTNYSGLEDDFYTDNPSELVDWIWEHASRGGYIEVEGPKNRIRLDPDDLAERVEFGDIGEYDIISQIDYL